MDISDVWLINNFGKTILWSSQSILKCWTLRNQFHRIPEIESDSRTSICLRLDPILGIPGSESKRNSVQFHWIPLRLNSRNNLLILEIKLWLHYSACGWGREAIPVRNSVRFPNCWFWLSGVGGNRYRRRSQFCDVQDRGIGCVLIHHSFRDKMFVAAENVHRVVTYKINYKRWWISSV